MNEEQAEAKANGLKGLNWPTVVMILASGAGNLFVTQHSGSQLSYEQQEGLRNIRELHSELDDFKRWQTQAGKNQEDLMRSDSQILREIHDIAVRLDRLKSLDQQRGMPQ